MTFDTSRFEARLAAARVAVRASAEQHLQEVAVSIVNGTGYTAPMGDSMMTLDPLQVLVPGEWSGTVFSVGVRTVEDWQLEYGVHHCESPDGIDCPTFAFKGPYTQDSEPAQPGDGTTPCDGRCYCALVPRIPDFPDPTPDVAAAISADLADIWRA